MQADHRSPLKPLCDSYFKSVSVGVGGNKALPLVLKPMLNQTAGAEKGDSILDIPLPAGCIVPTRIKRDILIVAKTIVEAGWRH
jgi:hypothetical protein